MDNNSQAGGPAKAHLIPLKDFFRATANEKTGNVGFIGLAPDGSEHHVVAPVDLQIARGVMACNRPTDGTPFGGYSGWHYFMCPAYTLFRADPEEELKARWFQARTNAVDFLLWAKQLGIDVAVEPDPTTPQK